MTSKLTLYLGILTFFACKQGSKKQLELSRKVINTNGLINLSVNSGSYIADTLHLIPFDSLDKDGCPSLIFRKENKLDACLPDIFKDTKMGISPKSSWNINSETGLLTLDIIETGMDDKTHYKAEYQLDKYRRDTLTIVRTKTIINE